MCVSKFCVSKLGVSKWCVCKFCVSKLSVSKWCVSKLCVSKLCVRKLCVRELCVSKLEGGGGGRRRRRQEAGGSAQPKTRTAHKDAGKKMPRAHHLVAAEAKLPQEVHPQVPPRALRPHKPSPDRWVVLLHDQLV